jgi:hypothetical protein
MSNQIITSDKEILKRVGKQSQPDPRTNQGSTPQPCPVCGEPMYPKHFGNKISYLHNCKAYLKSGKPLKRR